MKTYTTIQGDTWDVIAFKHHGTSKGMEEIIQANRQYIGTITFSGGIELDIPELELEKIENLPPWR